MSNFNELDTVKNIHIPFKKAADNIYSGIFKNCIIERFDGKGAPHILDQQLGVDLKITLSTGAVFTVQEKFRECSAWDSYHQFTQEMWNGDDTEGEWFHLHADWYFYGWCLPVSDKMENQFLEWFIMDIVEYKLIAHRAGGVENLGSAEKNKKHGKAKFVGIPYNRLNQAIRFHGTGKVLSCRKIEPNFFTKPIAFIKERS